MLNELCRLFQLNRICFSLQGDAPAPFMTFEAGNFPPELMREVISFSDKKDFAPICEMGALENVHWRNGLLSYAEVYRCALYHQSLCQAGLLRNHWDLGGSVLYMCEAFQQ